MKLLFAVLIFVTLASAVHLQTPSSYFGGNLMRNGLQTSSWVSPFVPDHDWFANNNQTFEVEAYSKPLIIYDEANERDLIIVYGGGNPRTITALSSADAAIVWQRVVVFFQFNLLSMDPRDNAVYYYDENPTTGEFFFSQINPLTGEEIMNWTVSDFDFGNSGLNLQVVDGIAILTASNSGDPNPSVLFYNLDTSTALYNETIALGSYEGFPATVNRNTNTAIIGGVSPFGVRAYDYQTGTPLWVFDLTDAANFPQNHGASFNLTDIDTMDNPPSFDIDGNVAVFLRGYTVPGDMYQTLYILDPADGSVISVTSFYDVNNEGLYNQATINPSSGVFFAADYGESLLIFDANTGNVTQVPLSSSWSDIDMPIVYNSDTGDFLITAYSSGYAYGNFFQEDLSVVDDNLISNYGTSMSIGSDGTVYFQDDGDNTIKRYICDPAVGTYFFNKTCISNCPNGFYPMSGLMACHPCEANEVSDGTTCVPCTGDEAPAPERDVCVTCPVGANAENTVCLSITTTYEEIVMTTADGTDGTDGTDATPTPTPSGTPTPTPSGTPTPTPSGTPTPTPSGTPSGVSALVCGLSLIIVLALF